MSIEDELKDGDDVTLNGVVVSVERVDGKAKIRLKSGAYIAIDISDINTYHPATRYDGIDKRKGN